ncbi:substrate-binding periplasmic protein [Undibacterium sp. SXout7W]|uniref:substrate-binding periplasmic protein n=1 Tax=Undibacterium sp. SXout7W TaxID=3413049 RepID=UPI003BF1383F
MLIQKNNIPAWNAAWLATTAMALVLILISMLPAKAVTLTGDDSPCGSLKLAFYEHGALYYQQQDGSYTGIDKDIVTELEKRTTCRFDTVLESRARIWSQMEKGLIDITMSGIPNPEREKYAMFFPYLSSHNYVLIQKHLTLPSSTPDSFLAETQLKIAVVKSFQHGYKIDDWLDKMRLQKRVIEVADVSTLFRIFKAGRVDAIIALPTTWAQHQAQKEFLYNARVQDWFPVETGTGGMVISKFRVSSQLAMRIEQVLREMHEDGSMEAIFKRHVNADIARLLLIDKYRRRQ